MRSQRGFTYMLVLFLVALTGVGLAIAGDIWATAKQREREAELLFAGNSIRQAIASYYDGSPGVKQYPPKLDDLIKDPRFPDTRRHLRQLYPDPFSGTTEWALINAPQGGIMGIASTSEDAPLKRTGFRGPDRAFEEQAMRLKEKLRYRDWEFIHDPALGNTSGQGSISPGIPPAPGMVPPRLAPTAQTPPAPGSPVPMPGFSTSASPAPYAPNTQPMTPRSGVAPMINISPPPGIGSPPTP